MLVFVAFVTIEEKQNKKKNVFRFFVLFVAPPAGGCSCHLSLLYYALSLLVLWKAFCAWSCSWAEIKIVTSEVTVDCFFIYLLLLYFFTFGCNIRKMIKWRKNNNKGMGGKNRVKKKSKFWDLRWNSEKGQKFEEEIRKDWNRKDRPLCKSYLGTVRAGKLTAQLF